MVNRNVNAAKYGAPTFRLPAAPKLLSTDMDVVKGKQVRKKAAATAHMVEGIENHHIRTVAKESADLNQRVRQHKRRRKRLKRGVRKTREELMLK